LTGFPGSFTVTRDPEQYICNVVWSQKSHQNSNL